MLDDQEAVDLIRNHLGIMAAAGIAAGMPGTSSMATGGAGGAAAAAGGGASDAATAAAAASAIPSSAELNPSKVKTAAQVLVDVALEKMTTDNVTALVIFL